MPEPIVLNIDYRWQFHQALMTPSYCTMKPMKNQRTLILKQNNTCQSQCLSIIKWWWKQNKHHAKQIHKTVTAKKEQTNLPLRGWTDDLQSQPRHVDDTHHRSGEASPRPRCHCADPTTERCRPAELSRSHNITVYITWILHLMSPITPTTK